MATRFPRAGPQNAGTHRDTRGQPPTTTTERTRNRSRWRDSHQPGTKLAPATCLTRTPLQNLDLSVAAVDRPQMANRGSHVDPKTVDAPEDLLHRIPRPAAFFHPRDHVDTLHPATIGTETPTHKHDERRAGPARAYETSAQRGKGGDEQCGVIVVGVLVDQEVEQLVA